LKFTAIAKGIEIYTNINKNIPSHAVGDPTRVHQILMNLINNAIKFTMKDGTITICVTSKQVGEELNYFYLCVNVVDTGIGISEDAKKTCFTMFTQADVSTTRKFGGTGLGLYICKQLVTLMSGEIGVTSKEGKGSIFWFDIKLKKTVPIKIFPDLVHKLNALTGLKVLLVEDNMVNQLIARKILTKFGAVVTCAENGVVALECIRKQSFHLILMDCHMPVMDGYKTTAIIRKMGNNIPIIALTANAMKEDVTRCLTAGMDDHITKPVTPTVLVTTLAKYSSLWSLSCKANC